jgi:predicted Rossmann-fold nucleotide-binding protein
MPKAEAWERAWQKHWRKIGPFPLILMGQQFWEGMRRWGQFMMKEGVFARDEMGFGHITDSPQRSGRPDRARTATGAASRPKPA